MKSVLPPVLKPGGKFLPGGLEAMACGAPVIASRIPSIVEAVGSDAARLISPTDVQAFARSIERILSDENERQQLSITGQQRAGEFSWEKAAIQLLEIFKKAHNQ